MRRRVKGFVGRELHVDQTARALGLLLGRRDSTAIASVVGVGYLVGFLWASQALRYRPDATPGLIVADDPLGLLFRRTGPTSFEPIALIDTGILRLLLSPVSIAIAVVVSVLVAISLGLSYLAVVQPKACGIGAGSGLLASLPALLSGTVCCGPVVLLVVGIQASGLLLTAFQWLLPVGVLLLFASVVYLANALDVPEGSREPTRG